jgi:hypothetical protein
MPPADGVPYGLLAEFARPEPLLDAVRDLRGRGVRRMEAYTPVPVSGLSEALGFEERWVPLLTVLGGLTGGALGYLMQWGIRLDFPIDVGGRPLHATPAFLVVSFELTMLGAALGAAGGMLALNRLPRLHHPVFDAERFRLATDDRFFLCVEAADPLFDQTGTRELLERLGSLRVVEVPP